MAKFIYLLRGFEQLSFRATKVRNVSKVGSQSEASRLHALWLISLVFQMYFLD